MQGGSKKRARITAKPRVVFAATSSQTDVFATGEVAPENRAVVLRCIPPSEEGYTMMKRRRFSGDLKAKVALEGLGEVFSNGICTPAAGS